MSYSHYNYIIALIWIFIQKFNQNKIKLAIRYKNKMCKGNNTSPLRRSQSKVNIHSLHGAMGIRCILRGSNDVVLARENEGTKRRRVKWRKELQESYTTQQPSSMSSDVAGLYLLFRGAAPKERLIFHSTTDKQIHDDSSSSVLHPPVWSLLCFFFRSFYYFPFISSLMIPSRRYVMIDGRCPLTKNILRDTDTLYLL